MLDGVVQSNRPAENSPIFWWKVADGKGSRTR